MFLSKHKSGYYYVYYEDTITEKRRSISTKTKRKSEANSFLSDFNRKLRERTKAGIIPITLEDFCRKYLFYSSSIHTDKTTEAYKTSFNQLKKYFGSIQLSQLSHQLMSEFIKYRLSSSSIYAARRDLINLTSAFNKAVTDNYLKRNPCSEIKRIKIPEKQPKFFKREEYEKLLNIIDDVPFKNLVEIAVDSGLRQMELLTLEWEQVKFDEKLIILDNRSHITKGKRIRSIPFTKRVEEILTLMFLGRIGEHVFQTNGNKWKADFISRKFKKYVLKADINPQLNFHSLRHSFASWLVQKGVSIYNVSKLLGHQDIKTTQIYAHVRTEDLRQSINVLNEEYV